jgi:hypothetical protein
MSFKYQPLPNINSYQLQSIDDIPLNTDIEVLACLEYKCIPEIVIIKGRYIEYKNFNICCRSYSLISKDRTGIVIRIPSNITETILSSRNNDYILSYKIYALVNRPNYLSKNSRYLYLGFDISLDEYINDDDKLIEKGKTIIADMLELF